jgi:hypothetical protein
MAVGGPLRNDPRFEKLAAWTAPKSGGWIGFEVSARKRPHKSDGVRLNSTFGPSSTGAPKARNSVPRNFWNRVVGVHEFDRSLTERCKPFLSDDYLRASPEHHHASLDSWRRIWDWKRVLSDRLRG